MADEKPPDPVKNKGAIWARLNKVLEEVAHVEKRGHNAFHNYKYVMEADLTDAIRPLMAKHGLSMTFGTGELKELTSGVVAVQCRITIGDIDGNEMVVEMWGTGQDKGDKALYKAYTGAVKYFLYKTFLISTNDDPENDSKADKEYGKPVGAQPPAARPAPAAAPKPAPAPVKAAPPKAAPPAAPIKKGTFRPSSVTSHPSTKPGMEKTMVHQVVLTSLDNSQGALIMKTSDDNHKLALEQAIDDGADVDVTWKVLGAGRDVVAVIQSVGIAAKPLGARA